MTSQRRTPPDRAAPAPKHIVRAAIARAILGRQRVAPQVEGDDCQLGDVQLLPHQRDAVVRLRTILGEAHVALLADDVGLGKTFVALALAREYAKVRIIAPAALLPMWRASAARAHCSHAIIESLQRYSRARPPHASGLSGALIIVDEAHHLRTPSTRRYRAVSEVLSGCDLLLISATPVHNTPNDLRALLALTMGTHAGTLSDDLLARVVVRRTRLDGGPRVVERPSIALPHDPAILSGILAIPAPLPSHDGAVAGALIRLGLLRAWCSSDAALAHALRQRLLRGEALKHAIDAGRHPTSAELRSWLVGDHEVQLAFPELLASHSVAEGTLAEVLIRHLNAVRDLLHDHQRLSRADVARASGMRAILAAHPDTPVVAFSQYATTVRAIGRALADIAGVGTLSGRRATIASGTISRRDALAHFAPVAQGRPPPPSHQRIRLLLTTDLLSEGVNLQDAGVIVHLDMPWTDAARRQRVGRLARVGSPHAEISVYRFDPPESAEAVLRLRERLTRKARMSQRLVGTTSNRQVNRHSAADAATMTRELLRSWLAGRPDSHWACASPVWCAVSATCSGFVAAVEAPDGHPALVGGQFLRGDDGRVRARVTTAPSRVLAWLRAAAADQAVNASDAQARRVWQRTVRAVRHWLDLRTLAEDMGDADWSSSSAHRLARRVLSVALSASSPAERAMHKGAFQDVYAMLGVVHGVAVERALEAWTAAFGSMPQEQWLSHWRAWPTLERAGRPIADAPPRPHRAPTGIIAALLMVQADNGRDR